MTISIEEVNKIIDSGAGSEEDLRDLFASPTRYHVFAGYMFCDYARKAGFEDYLGVASDLLTARTVGHSVGE